MPDVNFAEIQARFDRGDVTLAECKRLGSMHRAYGWACTAPGQFNEAQRAAYVDGFYGRRAKKEPVELQSQT